MVLARRPREGFNFGKGEAAEGDFEVQNKAARQGRYRRYSDLVSRDGEGYVSPRCEESSVARRQRSRRYRE
jgi:hypothetical protein